MTTYTRHNAPGFDYAPQDWMEAAACVGHDPEAWFADTFTQREEKRFALSVCASCPVQTACLAYAMEAESGFNRWGIYGGTTPDARRRLGKEAS